LYFQDKELNFQEWEKTFLKPTLLLEKRFEQANDILDFNITDIMFGEDAEALKETQVTQPAIYLHSTILSEVMGERFTPQMVAGHSLGEFSALVAAWSIII
jgi:[acyl-carrier-protein] S-malonyltransferase